MNQLPAFRFHHLTATVLLILLITASISCKKSSSSTSSTDSTGKSGSGALLSKYVLVAANVSGATVDSVVYNYQYDGNNNLTGLQQSTTITLSGAVSGTTISYTMTYSGNVITGLTGTANENVTISSNSYSATTQVNTTFQSSGGHVTSYVQHATTTGSPLVPTSPLLANDSALLTYDAKGNIATLTLYQIDPQNGQYLLSSTESFTFSGGNLSQTVLVTYAGGVAADTFTSNYQYDSKVSAVPLYLVPGIAIINANNLTQSVDTETGVNPGSVTTNYTNTYNSANQPSSSTATVTTTPANSGVIATENITYTYQ